MTGINILFLYSKCKCLLIKCVGVCIHLNLVKPQCICNHFVICIYAFMSYIKCQHKSMSSSSQISYNRFKPKIISYLIPSLLIFSDLNLRFCIKSSYSNDHNLYAWSGPQPCSTSRYSESSDKGTSCIFLEMK